MNKELPGPSTQDLEILFVDDDKIVCFIQKKSLERISPDAPIKVFHNGRQALEYLLQNKDSNKKLLILLDINMPVLNGWEFLEQASLHIRSIKYFTVMVSSSITAYEKERAFEHSRVVGFFEKPLTYEKLKALKEVKEIRDFFL